MKLYKNSIANILLIGKKLYIFPLRPKKCKDVFSHPWITQITR